MTIGRLQKVNTPVARKTIGGLNGILQSKDNPKKRKNNIYDALITSSLLYGAKTWRDKKQNKTKLEGGGCAPEIPKSFQTGQIFK